MSHPGPAPAAAAPALGRRLVWLMAAASGLIVANLYYIQPLLAAVARGFGVPEGQAGAVATLGQLGYALGLLLIVPLGDRLDRRRLIVVTLLAVAAALGLMALAPGLGWLALASFAVGATTVAAQIIVPLAASLAAPHERGRAVGTVMSGLLLGILLARTLSGFVGGRFGWRAMYALAAALMLGLALLLRAALPEDPPRGRLDYPALLGSLWELLRTQPVLREASLLGGLAFGAFSAFWVALAFRLAGPPFHYGSEVAGLFGLVGVAGALAASWAGALADRVDARRTSGAALLAALAAYAAFWLLGGSIWGLVLGVILLDLGVQAAHISNQTRVYSLIPEARSRLNTVYIVAYFIGGALGSALGTLAWTRLGWGGVCGVGALMLLAALGVFALTPAPRSGPRAE